MPRFATLLLDLDGTMVDAFTTIHRSYSHILPKLGLPAPTMAQGGQAGAQAPAVLTNAQAGRRFKALVGNAVTGLPHFVETALTDPVTAAELGAPALVDVIAQPLQDARAPVSEWVA